MTWTEVEDPARAETFSDAPTWPGRKAFGLSPPDRPADPTGKVLPAERKVGLEHQAQRRRHIKGGAVHLFAGQDKIVYPGGNRMARRADRDLFRIGRTRL